MESTPNVKYRSSFPYFDSRNIQLISEDIQTCLRNGVLTLGPYTQTLEKNFAQYLNIKHGVAVSSGASSLEIALRLLGVKDREVIVPTNTFVATPNSVIFAGGRPVFADIREDTLCIDPDDVKRRISPKTAGIIVVHIAGLVCPQIYELKKLCNDLGLFLLEDCAHAHGASINNQMAGTLGDAGCFSFAPTKNMTTGEGGMLVTNNYEMADKARSMRNRGLNSENLMIMLGHSWCLSEINSVLGIHQLRNMEQFLLKRNDLAKQYRDLLGHYDWLSLIPNPPNVRNGYHKFPIKIAEEYDVERIRQVLKEKYRIETGRVYYPLCHLHPYYQQEFGTCEGDFPVAEKTLKQILCLPIHLGISSENVKYIVNSLAESISS